MTKAVELQFEVVKLDYERTVGLLDSISRTRTSMRAAAVTAYLAFMSLAVQQESWALAAGACAVAIVFSVSDMYHGWLYHSGLRRANRLERLFQHRLRALDRPYDPYPLNRLHAELERYEFGALGQLPRFRLRLLRNGISVATLAGYLVAATVAGICAPLVG